MTNIVDLDQFASKKPTDLDLQCLQRQGISGFSMTWVKDYLHLPFQVLPVSRRHLVVVLKDRTKYINQVFA